MLTKLCSSYSFNPNFKAKEIDYRKIQVSADAIKFAEEHNIIKQIQNLTSKNLEPEHDKLELTHFCFGKDSDSIEKFWVYISKLNSDNEIMNKYTYIFDLKGTLEKIHKMFFD